MTRIERGNRSAAWGPRACPTRFSFPAWPSRVRIAAPNAQRCTHWSVVRQPPQWDSGRL